MSRYIGCIGLDYRVECVRYKGVMVRLHGAIKSPPQLSINSNINQGKVKEKIKNRIGGGNKRGKIKGMNRGSPGVWGGAPYMITLHRE
jgi:hypothetical protein